MNAINAMNAGAAVRHDVRNARGGASKSKLFGMPAATAAKTTKAAAVEAAATTTSSAAPVATSLQAAPASTVDFAQQREGTAYHVHSAHGGHSGAASQNASTESAGASSSTDSTTAALDPLDTNGDGVVSPEERVAGDLATLMKDLSASSGAASSSSLASASAATGSSVGNNDLQSAADKIKSDFGSFVDSVLKQYAQTASANASGASAGIAATA